MRREILQNLIDAIEASIVDIKYGMDDITKKIDDLQIDWNCHDDVLDDLKSDLRDYKGMLEVEK